jgi:ketosteroid isomerase-like protein
MGDPRITVRQDAAWVVGIETVRGRRPNGDAVDAATLATNILVKQDGRWLMAHHHASRMPPQ